MVMLVFSSSIIMYCQSLSLAGGHVAADDAGPGGSDFLVSVSRGDLVRKLGLLVDRQSDVGGVGNRGRGAVVSISPCCRRSCWLSCSFLRHSVAFCACWPSIGWGEFARRRCGWGRFFWRARRDVARLAACSAAPRAIIMTPLWFQEFSDRLRFTENRLLPSWWLSTGLLEASRRPASARSTIIPGPRASCFWCCLISNGLFFHQLAAGLARRVYRSSFSRLQGERTARGGRRSAGWIVAARPRDEAAVGDAAIDAQGDSPLSPRSGAMVAVHDFFRTCWRCTSSISDDSATTRLFGDDRVLESGRGRADSLDVHDAIHFSDGQSWRDSGSGFSSILPVKRDVILWTKFAFAAVGLGHPVLRLDGAQRFDAGYPLGDPYGPSTVLRDALLGAVGDRGRAGGAAARLARAVPFEDRGRIRRHAHTGAQRDLHRRDGHAHGDSLSLSHDSRAARRPTACSVACCRCWAIPGRRRSG